MSRAAWGRRGRVELRSRTCNRLSWPRSAAAQLASSVRWRAFLPPTYLLAAERRDFASSKAASWQLLSPQSFGTSSPAWNKDAPRMGPSCPYIRVPLGAIEATLPFGLSALGRLAVLPDELAPEVAACYGRLSVLLDDCRVASELHRFAQTLRATGREDLARIHAEDAARNAEAAIRDGDKIVVQIEQLLPKLHAVAQENR